MPMPELKGALFIVFAIILFELMIVLGFKIYELIYTFLDNRTPWWNKRID